MTEFLNNLPTMYKAVAAFAALLIPLLTAIATGLSDGIITAPEWVAISGSVTALVAGTGAVYQVRNEKRND